MTVHRRTAKGNRLGLASVGLLLLVGGLALVAADRDVVPNASGQRLYPSTVQRFVHDQSGWLWPVGGVVAVVVGLLFLRWLIVQLRVERLSRLTVDTDRDDEGDGAGRTSMPAAAVADAVERDVHDVRGVRRVRADLAGSPDAPQLWLSVHTESDADLGAIRRAVSERVVPDARTALEEPGLPAYLRLVVDRRAARSRDLA